MILIPPGRRFCLFLNIYTHSVGGLLSEGRDGHQLEKAFENGK